MGSSQKFGSPFEKGVLFIRVPYDFGGPEKGPFLRTTQIRVFI